MLTPCLVDCVNPSDLIDGSITSTNAESTTYSCDTGFQLVGSDTIACVGGSGWAALPTCGLYRQYYQVREKTI